MSLENSDQCCGFGGTFAVKNPETSTAMLSDKVRCVLNTKASTCTGGDNSCLMQIGGGLSSHGDGGQGRASRGDSGESGKRYGQPFRKRCVMPFVNPKPYPAAARVALFTTRNCVVTSGKPPAQSARNAYGSSRSFPIGKPCATPERGDQNGRDELGLPELLDQLEAERHAKRAGTVHWARDAARSQPHHPRAS